MRQFRFTCATASHISVAHVKHLFLPVKQETMDSIKIERLARRVQERRGGQGIRNTAREIGISPATLSRIENGRIPDLETFGKICGWLHEDPAIYFGMKPITEGAQSARVHFKKGAAIRQDSAKALSEMILSAQTAFLEEELES